MTYDESVRYLLSLGRELAAPRQPALGSTAGAAAHKFDLRNISILADRLNNPHRASPCVHIAGTNGKGSTAATSRTTSPNPSTFSSPSAISVILAYTNHSPLLL